VPGLESTLVAGGPWLALLGIGYRLSASAAPPRTSESTAPDAASPR